MSRVDLRQRYLRLPAKPSPAFPNRREIWYPVVRLGIQNGKKQVRSFALLDSGADTNFAHTALADALGIDWRSAPESSFAGIGAAGNVGHVVDVTLFLVDDPYSWPARIIFSPAMATFPFSLLGHAGFFEHFEVRFKTGNREFRIHLR